MGKGSSGGGVQQQVNPAAEELARIASTVFGETTPLRRGLTSQFKNLLGVDPRQSQLDSLLAQLGSTPATISQTSTSPGSNKVPGQPYNPNIPSNQQTITHITNPAYASLNKRINQLRKDITNNPFDRGNSLLFSPVTTDNIVSSPIYGALKDANESQFDLARQRALESLPAGGSLNQALTDIEIGRAGQATRNLGALAETEQARRSQLRGEALQLASGGTAGALSGLGSSGSLLAQAAQADAAFANAQANRDSGKAQGAGTLIGLGLSKGKA